MTVANAIGTWKLGTEPFGGTPASYVISPPTKPPPLPLLTQALNELRASVTRVVRQVNIYEEDGETLWLEGAPVQDGNVSVDGTRDERRSLDITFYNEDGFLSHRADGFWYDKIIKPYRGVQLQDGSSYFWPIGEFLIDKISSPHFPAITKVAGRDYTKKLVEDEFQKATTFVSGTPVEQVVQTIATNGGITKFILPTTNLVLTKDFLFNSKDSRWKAITDITVAYGYEVFFNSQGVMTMRVYQDPATRPSVFTFETGSASNLSAYETSATSTNLYNAVTVTSQTSDPNVLPVYGIAENHDPNSPASIERLRRRRTLFWESPLVTEQWQADAIAERLLTIAATDTFVANLTSLVFPFLEATDVVDFFDPEQQPGEPSRFLLTDFNIPLLLGTMTTNVKRISLITDSPIAATGETVNEATRPRPGPSATVPPAPRSVSATTTDSETVVSFQPPATNGGSHITGYTVSLSPGGITASGPASPITVFGLTNGVTYTAKVYATNGIGNGPPSGASDPFTPTGIATVPGAPTIDTVSAGDRQATVTWIDPDDNGGAAISYYTVTTYRASDNSPLASVQVFYGHGNTYTQTLLTNGVGVYFKIVAVNAVGSSPATSASATVTPASVTPAWDATTFYDPGTVRTFDTHTWRAKASTAMQQAPQGLGDGTTADRQRLLSQLTRGSAGGLVTGGGLTPATYIVTHDRDDGSTGNLRTALERVGADWIIFDKTYNGGKFNVRFATSVSCQQNKTLDGRGAAVTIGGYVMEWYGFTTALNVILAYLTFTDIWSSASSSSAWSMGGNGVSGNPAEFGSADLVYVHHCTFTDIRDSMCNTSMVAQYQCRQTYDWCKIGPNPGPIMAAKAGGFRSISGNVTGNVFTTPVPHGFTEGVKISIYSRGQGQPALPGGITSKSYGYYARNVTSTTFQVSTTASGPIVVLSSNGVGYAIHGDFTAPYMGGKGPHWGVNHAAGTTGNPPGDPDTGDSTYATHADAVAGTSSVGYLRPSITLCNFENMMIRCPDLTACFGHIWNCRNYHWGTPDGGGGGIAHEAHDQSEVWDQYNIFRPYVAGDPHAWGSLLPTPGTWLCTVGTPGAIVPKSTDRVKIQTRIAGLVANWYHGIAAILGDGDSTASEAARELNFTRTNPTWTIPYAYDKQTDEATLEQMILRGAGNVQPWELVS